MFRFLPPEASVIVKQAQLHRLPGSQPPPAYLTPGSCTVLMLLLAVPTLGYSLLLVPLLWVAQHDRTDRRIELLRSQLRQVDDLSRTARGHSPARGLRRQDGRVSIVSL